MASIRDVAKSAGVSTATVSNVLNGRSEKVSAETREKVLAAVRQLKYRPTPLEHNQKAILSQNLGVMVPDLTEGPLVRHGYFRNVLDGILEEAAFRGWSITIFVERMWDDVGHAVRRSYDGRCDGLIMVAPQPGNEVVQMMHERGTPLVLVGTTPWLSNVSSVDVDNEGIGTAAAQRLIGLGHRRLAFFGHNREQVSSIERRESFFREAKRAGLTDHQLYWISASNHSQLEQDYEIAVRELLSIPDPPTGLFCWHDGFAWPILEELNRLGYRVPQDFSVIAVDDAPECLTTNPPLSSFKNPLHEIGMRAAKMVIDRLASGSDATEHVRYKPELSVRDSLGAAPLVAISASN